MRHRKSGRHFSRTAAHRNSMLDTLATQLLDHEAIQTTEAKAKELRSVVEKLITLAKVDTVHRRPASINVPSIAIWSVQNSSPN